MAFRDDHEALRTRIEALEEELSAATAALDASRSRPKTSGVGPAAARWIFIALGLIAGAIALYLGFGLSGYVGERAGIAVLVVGIVLVMLGTVIGQFELSSPDEVLILVGRRSNLPDGSMVGFTVVSEGRAVRLPFIERVARLSLRPVWIDGALRDVRAKRGTVSLRYRARVEIERGPDIYHAIERFLEQPLDAIRTSAEHAIEGSLRGVVSHMTAEEIASEVFLVAERTREEMEDEIRRLGLSIPSFRLIGVEIDAPTR